MPSFVANTVSVTVTRATRPITEEGLDIPVYLIPHNLSTNTIDSFVDTASVTSFGAAINSPLYSFVNNTFAGANAPDLVKVAHLTLDDITITVNTLVAVGEDLSVNANVNDVASVVSYTVQGGDDLDATAAGLAAALTTAFPAIDTSNPTFAAVGNVITVSLGTVDPYGISFGWQSLTGTIPHVVIEGNTSESLVTVLTGAVEEDGDFFYVGAESHSDADIAAVAGYAQSNDLMYITSTDDDDVKDSASTSNIALTLQAASYSNTALLWSGQAPTHFPEAAWVGYNSGIRAYTPNTMNLATLVGIAPDPVTVVSTQDRITLVARNVNYYHIERKENVLKQGTVSDGNFFDTIRFSLWLKFSTTATVFSLLKQASDLGTAVPYSDAGAARIESRIWNDVIDVGVNGGAILDGFTTDASTGKTIDLNPVVDAGTRAQQTNTNISNRLWDNVVIEVVYAGAIHEVKINCYVILNRDPS